jgi:hypothetical protein
VGRIEGKLAQLRVFSFSFIFFFLFSSFFIFLYHVSPYFQNPSFNLGFDLTSSIYSLIILIIIIIILFNAQT